MPERSERTGFHNFLGYCWVSGQLGERMPNFCHQRQFLALSWFCLVSFSLHPSCRRRRSFDIFRASWLAAHLSQLHTTLHHHRQPSRRICCYHVLSWCTMKVSSRRCCRCMMVHTWLLRGRSKFRWAPGLKLFPLTDSSPATPHRMRRPPNRPQRSPPNAIKLSVVRQPPLHSAMSPAKSKHRHRVSFACPLVTSGSSPQPASAVPASAASATRHRVRPPCPLYEATGTLHRLRTNIPSCKNAVLETPHIKITRENTLENTTYKKICRTSN